MSTATSPMSTELRPFLLMVSPATKKTAPSPSSYPYVLAPAPQIQTLMVAGKGRAAGQQRNRGPRREEGRMGWERKRGGATSTEDESSNTEEHQGALSSPRRKISAVISELSPSLSSLFEGDNDDNNYDEHDDDIGHVGDEWETNLRYSTTWRGRGACPPPQPGCLVDRDAVLYFPLQSRCCALTGPDPLK
jgi:hypothetical protein